jgi:hypothetical protein
VNLTRRNEPARTWQHVDGKLVKALTAWRAKVPVFCEHGPMPMRTECKNYESRTYASGETVRKCNLDLAPEAPWRCPENCPAFAPRLVDVNWSHGDLLSPPTPPEPPGLDDGAAQLLDEAEDILNAAGPKILAEMGEARGARKPPPWQRFWRRKKNR